MTPNLRSLAALLFAGSGVFVEGVDVGAGVLAPQPGAAGALERGEPLTESFELGDAEITIRFRRRAT